MYCFSSQVDVGTQRETIFLNQLQNSHVVTNPSRGDFVAENVIFEVGGKNKSKSQIAGLPNAFLVLDDIEYGSYQRIPLWLFGFLY
jgi:uncharacterized protein